MIAVTGQQIKVWWDVAAGDDDAEDKNR